MSMRIRINSKISALFHCISPNYAFLSGGDCNKLHKVKKKKHKKVVHPWGGGLLYNLGQALLILQQLAN